MNSVKFVLYNKETKQNVNIKNDPYFANYGVVFNIYGQVILTSANKIIGLADEKYILRIKK